MPEATVVVNNGFTLFRNTNKLLSSTNFWYIYLPWIDQSEPYAPFFPSEYYNDKRCCIYVFPWSEGEETSLRDYLLPSKIDINLSDFSFNIYGSNRQYDYSNTITVYGTVPEASRNDILSLISLYNISCTATTVGGVPILQTIWTELYSA